MKLLLDTHILLWTLTNDPKLSAKARKFLENEENEIYFSIISLWEVELKHLAHPDQMTLTAVELIDYCQQSGFQLLSIHESHILANNEEQEFTQFKRISSIYNHCDGRLK